MYSESEERETVSITAGEFAHVNDLKLLQGNSSDEMKLSTINVNRPGLLLSGFEDYFGDKRVQVIGNAESYYLQTFPENERERKLEALFSRKIPCVILSKNIAACPVLLRVAERYNVPLFSSNYNTSGLINMLTNYLNDLLAYSTSMHGTLLEVSGIGVMITGNSGMGKSETAMELVHRGHRLVADDNVIVKRIQNNIIGYSPERIRHFMEIRGIGIINVQSMFGVASVLNERKVDLVIELKQWYKDMDYDRLGLVDEYENILGENIPKLNIPVMPGRNLAIVVEVAARNQRLKMLGFNAAEQLLSNVEFEKKSIK